MVWVDATGIYLVEARNAARHSIICRTAPQQNHPAPNVSSAEAEKPWGREKKVCVVPLGWESPGVAGIERSPDRAEQVSKVDRS